jgi:hypothetical protein
MLIPMHDTEETSSIRMDLCPYLRYLRSRVDTIQREYHQRPILSAAALEAKVLEAVDLARIITNVIEPLARDAQPVNIVREYHHLAERLYDLAQPWSKGLDPDYPAQMDRSLLILDRIEQLENRINRLFERRTARSQERRVA